MVAGTRPEGVKFAPILQAARSRRDMTVALIATGQHPTLLHQALAEFGLTADLDLALPNHDPDQFRTAVETRLPATLCALRPDLLLVQGDTNSAWVAALTAHRLGIAVGHVEAGLRSGDPNLPWPEERNRGEIDRISTLLFAPSETAAANLAKMPGEIILTGNTGIDAFLHMLDGRKRVSGSHRTILVTCHRREAIGRLEPLALALRTLADRPDVRLCIPLHPNPHLGGVLARLLADHPRISLEAPQPYRALVDRLTDTDLLLTDSGGLQEEAPAIGLPTLVLRTITERPEPIASGNARLVGLDPGRILHEANRLLDDPVAYAAMAHRSFPYGHGDAAPRILDAIECWWAHRPLPFPFAPPSRKGASLERMDDGDELDARKLEASRGAPAP
jgi:UDP-N-acetylglucosamine 2-epimerase (non-hydrolysing)